MVGDKGTRFIILNCKHILIAMLAEDKDTEIFVMVDEFCEILDRMLRA